ncbi:amino acid adenylation domain-containing protein [Massilia sp. METH4]|uniref:non-ribosomal peptide synthetase n=1 Tax=Massilia sp. METH4 TaxID=3123041 RepID=UPI0030CD84AF
MDIIEKIAGLSRAQTDTLLARMRERREAVARGQGVPRLEPDGARRRKPFPLTEIQQAYWVGRQGSFAMGNVSAHGYLEVEAHGADLERLERAFNRVIARHDMLRAVVQQDGNQRILADVPYYRFKVEDLSAVPAPQRAERLAALRNELSHQVLPADVWPLFEIRATRLPDRVLRLHLSLDVLILDAHSFDLISADWQHYHDHPDHELPPLAFSFADYEAGLRQMEATPTFQESLQYWRKRMDDLPPPPEFPLARSPESIAAPKFTHRSLRLPRADWDALKKRAGALRITPAALLLSIYACVVRRWSQSPRFTLNLTLFNRLPFHPDVDRLVGDFTTVTLLAFDLSAPRAFADIALGVQKQLWQDLDHRAVSGVRVLRELTEKKRGAGSVMMPVVFTGALNNANDGTAEAPLDWVGHTAYSVTQTPQVWLDCQAGEYGGDLAIDWDSVDELFQHGFVDAMFDAFTGLLQRLARDGTAWQHPRQDLLPAGQETLMARANATAAPVPAGLLHEPLLAQCRARPDSLAVADGSRTLTFGALYREANALAHALCAREVPTGALVAVMLPKSAAQVVAVLGILEAGAAYLPIEPSLPQERIDEVLRLSGAAAVVTDTATLGQRSAAGVVIELDSLKPGAPRPLPPLRAPTDLAYVIYTSGSTGTPKGVAIDHRGALNTCVDVNARMQVNEDDRVLGLSALNFDLSVWDIFGVLGAGGALVLPAPEHAREPAHWAEIMARHHVTLWNTVPALLDLYVGYLRDVAERPDLRLRVAMMSGDWISLALPAQIRRWCPNAAIYSLGGATEASIWSIIHPVEQVDPAWRSIPYGRPMLNQTFHVRDANLDHCPVGVPGELCIGGIGVAVGYWNDPARTAQAFVRCPHSGDRLYRTGDLGRWLPDGTLEILGRIDFQVKVNGYRVELGEIESAMNAYPGVQTAVANVSAGTGKAGQLLGYYVRDDDAGAGKLKSVLSQPGLRRLHGVETVLGGAAPQGIARRSTRVFAADVVPPAALARLLEPLRQGGEDGMPRYRYASAGGLYPVQLYLHITRVEGIEPGIYYYHPVRNALQQVAAHVELDMGLYPRRNQPIAAAAAFRLFLVGSRQAIEPQYGASAQPLCLLEAGAMSHLLEDAAAAAGLGLVQLGGFDAERAGDPFALGADAMYLHMLAGGLPGRETAETDAPVSRAAFEEGLRAHLARRLPEYMVPRQFVRLDKLPLSANGKVDRKALPEPETRRVQGASRAGAASPLAAEICALWAEVLGVPQVGPEDNFFDLGGTSVDMIRIHTRLQPRLPREVSLVDMFFGHPTIADLVRHMEGSAAGTGNASTSDTTPRGRRRRAQ